MSERLFVYGTLQPGASHWALIEPMVRGTPRRTTLPGTLYDTGRGYPALALGDGPGVPGWVLELRVPARWSVVDSYEGPEYRRVLVDLPDGAPCWTYVWVDGFAGLRRLAGPWPP